VLRDTPSWGATLINMSTTEAKKFAEVGERKVVGESRQGYYVRLSFPKIDYGEAIEDRWFKRVDGGLLLPIELGPVRATKGGKKPARMWLPVCENGDEFGDDW